MENEIRLRKIGMEKIKSLSNNFDTIYDKYKKKAKEMGYFGDLKFIKERGKMLIYIIIEYK